MSRTLIVYLHGIGDNIMLSGVLKEYCRQHPDEKIDLVVLNTGCAAIWQNNPLVNSVSIYPGRQPYFWNPALFYLFHQWTARQYIRALNHDGRYQRVFFPTIQTLPEIIYHLTGTYGRHKLERICRSLDLPPELHRYDLHTTPADAEEAASRLQKFSGARLAVLHPFSGHGKKRLSAASVSKILDALGERGYTPFIVGAAADQAQLEPSWQTESAFGLPLGVLTEVLKRAEIFVGTDSAVTHLAAFANTPRLVIFSPKLKPDRYRPISERSRITFVRFLSDQPESSLNTLISALG